MANAATVRRVAKPKAVVPDDWEDDDDEEEEEEEPPSEETNKKIWEDANSKVPAPMPVLNISSSSSVTSAPPPAVFQPMLKILKRPTSNQTNIDSRTPSPASAESLRDREARYQAARNRIFGNESASSSTETATTTPRILRDPYGPDATDTNDATGFAKRRAKPPSNTSSGGR
uniref:SUZ RNA-binding domain-containing n=1 Tax=Moniliophthora roreri TaxID=221103 RepID=A0A0W0FV14_MONRR